MTQQAVHTFGAEARAAHYDFATLHRDESRHRFFEAVCSRPPFFEPLVNAWIVADPRLALSFLQRRELECPSGFLDDLQSVSGHTLPNIVFAHRHTPVFLTGSEHRESRGRLATFLNARRLAVAPTVPALVETCVEVLDRRGEMDLVQEALKPLVVRFILAINDIAADERTVRSPAALFDRLLSMRKRLRLEQDIGALRALIRGGLGPEASDEDEGVRLALFIFGHDSLIGTLAESLLRIFRSQAGLRLCEMQFPQAPVETGVPFTERMVTEAFEHEGIAFQPGARVRIMLQAFSYAKDLDPKTWMFGVGMHSCVGRTLSLDLWSHLTKRLSMVERRIEVLSYELCADDYVAICPSKFSIRLSAYILKLRAGM